MRLADAELLPYDFANFTDTIGRYISELQKLATQERDQIIERNRQIDEGVFSATNDPKEPMVPPAKQIVPPFLSFAPTEKTDLPHCSVKRSITTDQWRKLPLMAGAALAGQIATRR